MRRLIFYLIWTIVVLYLIWILPGIYLFFETSLFADEYGYTLSDNVISELKSTLGYDKSFIEGIKDFLSGNWGKSLIYGGSDVFTLVIKHMLRTLYVLLPTYIVAFVIALFLATVDVRAGRKVPFISLAFVHSVPVFLWSFLLYGLLGRYLGSTVGVIFSIFIAQVSSFYIAIRGILITENAPFYMLYAEAYGIYGVRLYMRGIKPAIPHLFQIFAGKLSHVLGGIPFVEVIWRYSGIGYLTFHAITSGDLALIRGSVMSVSLLTLISVILTRLYKDVRHSEKD